MNIGGVPLEVLVPISGVVKKIQIYPYYYHMGHPGADDECYLRKAVLQKLVDASRLLPDDVYFVVLDGWRSYETQLSIYEQTKIALQEEGFEGEALTEELFKYVATPSEDISKPSPHLTGGAIDLTLAHANSWLPMGSDFDEFNAKSQPDWFEKKTDLTEEETEFLNNRDLLRKAMLAVGFIPNQDEWWHFEYGTKDWAKQNRLQNYYQGILNREKSEG